MYFTYPPQCSPPLFNRQSVQLEVGGWFSIFEYSGMYKCLKKEKWKKQLNHKDRSKRKVGRSWNPNRRQKLAEDSRKKLGCSEEKKNEDKS